MFIFLKYLSLAVSRNCLEKKNLMGKFNYLNKFGGGGGRGEITRTCGTNSSRLRHQLLFLRDNLADRFLFESKEAEEFFLPEEDGTGKRHLKPCRLMR